MIIVGWLEKEEMEFINHYIELQKIRFQDKVEVRVQIPDEYLDYLVPSLILQPLVENAVYYGIEPSLKGGELVISGRYRLNRLFISVRNPIANNKSSRPSNKIALENLKARLDGCFQGSAAVKIKSDKKHYQITIEIPYRQ